MNNQFEMYFGNLKDILKENANNAQDVIRQYEHVNEILKRKEVITGDMAIIDIIDVYNTSVKLREVIEKSIAKITKLYEAYDDIKELIKDHKGIYNVGE